MTSAGTFMGSWAVKILRAFGDVFHKLFCILYGYCKPIPVRPQNRELPFVFFFGFFFFALTRIDVKSNKLYQYLSVLYRIE